jgi:hypothetical protein
VEQYPNSIKIEKELADEYKSEFGQVALDSLGIVAESHEQITDKQKECLNNLRDFYSIDNAIKNSLLNMKLQYEDIGYGDTYKYREKLLNDSDSLGRLFDDLAKKVDDLGFGISNSITESSDLLMNKFYDDLSNKKFDFDDLERVCNKDVITMDPEFMKVVSTEMAGYYLGKNFYQVVDKVKTFSELLHLVHTYIQSDENFYEKLPKWGEVNGDRINYRAYGEETKYSSIIFNDVTSILKEGHIDALGNDIPPAEIIHLFSLDNKIQMMVRDYGHALSIEVDTTDPRAAIIRYNIPKAINIDVINQLPGVRKLDSVEGRVGTSGAFEIPYDDNIGKNIAEFIKQVPTDSMIIRR